MKKMRIPPIVSLVLALLLVSTANAAPDCPPAAVELASFTVTQVNRTWWVRWETEWEIDNLGFNVYGSHSPFGPMRQLNHELIPSNFPGSPLGNEYGFIDGLGQGPYYWLEAVDAYGESGFHGPVTARLRLRIDVVRTRPPVRTLMVE